MHMADTSFSVQANWTRLRPLILKAVPQMGGTHDEADLIKAVLAGEMTFWPGKNSFLLASIEVFPRQTRCNLVLANGDPDECLELRAKAIAWAATKGATKVITYLRPAADRMAQRGHDGTQGWTRGPTFYHKEI